jgi:uncharacterized protein (TIGR03032 family)
MTEPTLAPIAFRVRPAAPGDLAAIQLWLPRAFWGSHRLDVFAATTESGALVGAASLRLQGPGQFLGRFHFFVEPQQRRRGCGRCLLQALRGAARRAGVHYLQSEGFLEESEDGAAFCRAVGLAVAQEKVRYRIDLARADALFTEKYRQLEQAGGIPAGARIGALEQADRAAVAAFAAEQMGCFPEDVLTFLHDSSTGFDPQGSTVIHLGQRLVGVQLTRTQGTTSFIEIKAVAPDQRGGWVNLALMFRSTRERRRQGIDTSEFEAITGEHDNTVKLAQRLGAVEVGRTLSFGLELSADPAGDDQGPPLLLPRPPEVLVTGESDLAAPTLRARCSANFPDLLDQLGIALAVTTGPAGRLMLLRADHGVLSAHCRRLDRTTGLAVAGGRLALATRMQIREYHNAPGVAARLEPPGRHDACYLLRGVHVTGDLGIEELAWAGEELGFVSSRFSCVGTRDDHYSFRPRWHPPAAERCQLTGLCAAPGAAASWLVSLIGPDGGRVMDTATNDVLVRGLALPCSPRWYAGRLWLLEAGTGTLGCVDPSTGRYGPVARLPGRVRGLAFHQGHAFVGLSRIGVESGSQSKCVVWVLDLASGQTVAWLELEGAAESVFAVEVLPGQRFPELLGDHSARVADSFVLPDQPLGAVPRDYVRRGA